MILLVNPILEGFGVDIPQWVDMLQKTPSLAFRYDIFAKYLDVADAALPVATPLATVLVAGVGVVASRFLYGIYKMM